MTVKTFLLHILTVCVALLGQACLLDIPPRRAPLDELWKQWMLEGHYGRWKDGQEVPWDRSRKDTIHSYPEGAARTEYGIDVSETRSTNAGWHLAGGLIGRIYVSDRSVELFAKETTRVHGPTYTAAVGRDHTYEFFLVVRPGSNKLGQLIRQWRFQPEELALSGDPTDPAIFQKSTRSRVDIEGILHLPRGAYPRHFLDGHLDFDPSTKIATVTVTGLKRPFHEHVSLSNGLQP
ncbi:MAG TPA: hypothetical protein VGV13_07075 [Methylomirabilota bacterium]|nr:hypothetical protein [Methylomirabilota bacterium]